MTGQNYTRRSYSGNLNSKNQLTQGMAEILKMQENEANNAFSKFMVNNYLGWLNPENDK